MNIKHIESKHIPHLTEIERIVILTLAQNGPMSGYDFHLGGKRKRGSRKAIMSSGYWIRAKKKLGLEGLNLIQSIKTHGRPKSGSGRRKKLYWLTEEGIRASLVEGANPESLLKNVKKYFPKNNDTEYRYCFLELSQIPVMRKFLQKIFLREIIEGPAMLDKLSYLQDFTVAKELELNAKSPETKRIIKILKKYPYAYQMFISGLDESEKRIKQFKEVLSHE